VSKLRRYFIAGLLVWLPLGVTIYLIKILLELMDRSLLLLPQSLQPEQLLGFRIPGLGAVLLVALVLVTGMVAANLFGRQLVRLGEYVLERIPLVRTIYSAAKQLTESLFSGSGRSFRKVVLIEYPRSGLWTLAFLTGTGVAETQQRTGRELINVFVPTTPNPTSGFFLMVPRDGVIELEMSVDAAFKIILSAGAVVPPGARAAESAPPRIQPV
jgi:uncharacterized membrane protein